MGAKLQESVVSIVLGFCMLAVLGMARPAPTPGAGGSTKDSYAEPSLPPPVNLDSEQIQELNTTVVPVLTHTDAASISTVDVHPAPIAANANRSPDGMVTIAHKSDIVSGSAVGSKPPDCDNKCGICTPCVPVQIPVGSVHTQEEYYPEVWRCKCENKFYNP